MSRAPQKPEVHRFEFDTKTVLLLRDAVATAVRTGGFSRRKTKELVRLGEEVLLRALLKP